MVTATKDAQVALWDREIEGENGEAIAAQIAIMFKNEDAAKAYRHARNEMIKVVKVLDLADGERLRCGDFVITGKARAGGGFEVPVWESVTVGRIRQLPLE